MSARRPRLPVALADQAEAAAREVGRVVASAIADKGYGEGDVGGAVSLLEVALRQWAAAGRATCQHLVNPQPVTISLWTRAMLCAPCATSASLSIQGTAEDLRCDRCGQVQDSKAGIAALIAASGALVVVAGVCVPCQAAHLRGEAWPR